MSNVADFAEGYELIDFGGGAKLERFGPYTLQRVCPTATRDRRAHASVWKTAMARYTRDSTGKGRWSRSAKVPDTWNVPFGSLRLNLRTTPAGQVGVFPEQQPNWLWIRRQLKAAGRPVRVLNLFGYTGAASLAAATMGAHVTHVDAARNIVNWARANAQLTGVGKDAICWITEDARKFVQREARRGNTYQAIVLDPPSYGHGPQNEPWKIGRDLSSLLTVCRQILDPRPVFVILTCHSPAFGPPELQAALDSHLFHGCSAGSIGETLNLRTADGRKLRSGSMARWPGTLT